MKNQIIEMGDFSLFNKDDFESSEGNGVLIKYDDNLIDKFLGEGYRANDKVCCHVSIKSELRLREMRNEIKMEADEQDEHYVDPSVYRYYPFFIKQDTYRFIHDSLLSREIKPSSRIMATLCRVAVRMSRDMVFFNMDYNNDMITHEEQKKRNDGEIPLINFLKNYAKGEYKINKINIQFSQKKNDYRAEMTDLIPFPIDWFDAFLYTFKKHFQTSEEIIENILSERKKQAEEFNKTYLGEKKERDQIIRIYACGIDEMLQQEFKIEPRYKRHCIIGELFFMVGIYPGDLGTEQLADRVRQLIKRRKKE